MPREAKTKYPLLGFLSIGPQSGYDIRKKISQSLANFWSESYGQIYPTLQNLEEEGLARRHDDAGGRMERNVYTITEAGRSELRRWLKMPAVPQIHRMETLLKVFFAEAIGPEECLKHIENFRAENRSLVAVYEKFQNELPRVFAGLPGLPYWLLTLDCGLRVGRAYLEWCNHAETVLRKLHSEKKDGE